MPEEMMSRRPGPTLVSLTFDDGLASHLDVAAPLLDRHGLRGTFYLPINSDTFAPRAAEWRAVAQRGHELGNHTVFHPSVSSKPWVSEGIAIERYSLDRMQRELAVANAVLQTMDGRTERTFAYPCSYPWLGQAGWPRRALTRLGLERTRIMGWVDKLHLDFGSELVDYTPVVARHFVAARCGGADAAAIPRIPPDRYRIRAFDGDGASAARLLQALDIAIERASWIVFQFHIIGDGERLACATEAFQSLIDRLASDDRVEVLPLVDAARRIWGN